MEKYSIYKFKTVTREPVIRQLKDKSLICTFLTGGETEPRLENVVALSRSFDRGMTWSEPETIVKHSSRGCWSTEVFVEDGKATVYFQTYYPPSHYRELINYKTESKDCGKSWDEPISIKGLNGVSVRQGFKMSNGEILFPVYWQEISGEFDWKTENLLNLSPKWRFISGVAVSKDGEHFEKYGYLETPDDMWEPNAVEVEDGHIILYGRNISGYLYFSESFDYGRTWSKAEKSDIKNANSKFSIVKVNKKILLINNFNDKAGWNDRNNLSVAVSDDGKNFGEKLFHIEDEKEVWFYPHAFADYDEKMLYVSYENSFEHKLVKIGFDELQIQGR